MGWRDKIEAPAAAQTGGGWRDRASQSVSQPTEKSPGMVKKAIDFLSTEKNPEQDPEANAMLQTFGYLGGLGSTIGIHGTPIGVIAKYLAGKADPEAAKIELMNALKGHATPASEQLEKYIGLSPTAAGIASIPYTAVTDPLASMFGMNPEAALSGAAENAAIRHLRPTPKLAESLGPKRLRDVGREALDTGAIKFGAKAEDTAVNLLKNKLESGQVIGDYLNSSKAKIDPKSVAEQFDREVIEPLRGINENKTLVKQLERKRDSFLENYGAEGSNMSQVSPLQINKEKGAVQDSINYLDSRAGAKPRQQAQMDWANVLKKTEEKAMDSPGFNAAKRSYGNSVGAETMADKTAALTNGGTGLTGSLADLGVNLEAIKELANGNPAGVPIALGRALTKGRIASSSAVSLDAMAQLAKKIHDLGGDSILRQNLLNNAGPYGEEK